MQAANKTLRAMLADDREQTAAIEAELDEMRAYLLIEEEIPAARFLAVLQASTTCPVHI